MFSLNCFARGLSPYDDNSLEDTYYLTDLSIDLLLSVVWIFELRVIIQFSIQILLFSFGITLFH